MVKVREPLGVDRRSTSLSFNILLSLILVLSGTVGFAQDSVRFKGSRMFGVEFANDFIQKTDRYYTNGIKFSFTHEALRKAPVYWLGWHSKNRNREYSGLELVHFMFTPQDIDTDTLLESDRPYCGLLLLGNLRSEYITESRYLVKTAIYFGTIGEWAFAKEIQDFVHGGLPTSAPARGWEYQIRGDIAVNYSLAAEKALYSLTFMDQQLFGEARLGIPFTDLKFGSRIRLGEMDGYFKNNGLFTQKRWQAFAFLSGFGQPVFYNATLQGGLINRDSPQTVNPESFVYGAQLGFVINFQGLRGEVGIQYLSPEFEGGSEHTWSYASLKIAW